jgi:hypothetical protein
MASSIMHVWMYAKEFEASNASFFGWSGIASESLGRGDMEYHWKQTKDDEILQIIQHSRLTSKEKN